MANLTERGMRKDVSEKTHFAGDSKVQTVTSPSSVKMFLLVDMAVYTGPTRKT